MLQEENPTPETQAPEGGMPGEGAPVEGGTEGSAPASGGWNPNPTPAPEGGMGGGMPGEGAPAEGGTEGTPGEGVGGAG